MTGARSASLVCHTLNVGFPNLLFCVSSGGSSSIHRDDISDSAASRHPAPAVRVGPVSEGVLSGVLLEGVLLSGVLLSGVFLSGVFLSGVWLPFFRHSPAIFTKPSSSA
jgi:hypothetical protein